MYCSTCGVAVVHGLVFCNYCGAKLNPGETSAKSDVKSGSLIGGMVFVFVFGIVAITMLLGMMKAVLRVSDGLIVAFALLSFLTMLVIEGVFIRLLLRRTGGREQASEDLIMKGQATRELDASQVRVLPEPLSSVTEQTTRTFDPIYTERK